MGTKPSVVQPLKVLLVDDDEVFLMSTTNRLMLRGVDVHAFLAPSEALAASESNEFDVALLDLKMPEMSGLELMEQLRRHQPDIETVVITAYGSIDSAVRCTDAGAYFYLNKPCDTDDLIAILSSAFARRLKNRFPTKVARVDNLLSDPRAYSPVALLDALEKLAAEPR